MQEEFMKIDEFAKLLKVHPNTIRKSIREGRINAFRIGPKKQSAYRIPRSEIHRIALEDYIKIKEKYGIDPEIDQFRDDMKLFTSKESSK